ncbi:MAG: hypothetical protein ABEK00_03140 [Candidatus Nanohaloarchaea archaeon]
MYKKTVLILLTLLTGTAAAQVPVHLQANNSQGNTVSANYTILQNSNIEASSLNSLDTSLPGNENYTIIQAFNLSKKSFNVTIYDLNLTQAFNPEIQVVNYTRKTPYLENPGKIYATTITHNYRTAKISYNRKNTERIFYCSDFDFSSSKCLNSELKTLNQYETGSDPFYFNTTDFSAYTVGEIAPRLNLSEIKIYNVTGLTSQQKRDGGTLIEKGLNQTFQIKQKTANSYRFEFQVQNTGTDNWSIKTEDRLTHKGLSQDWQVGDIWYELNGTRNGGTFSLGEVTWDTSNNGVLTAGPSQDSMNASYIVNVTDTTPDSYQEVFNVTDVSSGAQSVDWHTLKIERPGDLGVKLFTPPNNTILRQNGTFYIVSNVSCSNYDCGTVSATPRYNASTGQKVIPENSGKPFYLKENPVKSCNLNAGETCELNWTANATGDLETRHLIDVNASTSQGLSQNNSEDHLVEIDTIISMSLSFDVIDFGLLDPGVQNRPAKGNSEDKYNISISENSKPVEELWIKGTDLVSTADPDYEIGVSNITYGLQNNVSKSHKLSKNYSLLETNIDPGTTLTSYYWIDVPYGMTQSGYNGTITFKANSTD